MLPSILLQSAPTVNEHNALLEAVRSMLRDELQQRPPQPQQSTATETNEPTALAQSHERTVNENKDVFTETDAPQPHFNRWLKLPLFWCSLSIGVDGGNRSP